jgi:hypothetical protein
MHWLRVTQNQASKRHHDSHALGVCDAYALVPSVAASLKRTLF